jgi:murein DD-endopeptidase MepM/ murein hydrolase activator NlpD
LEVLVFRIRRLRYLSVLASLGLALAALGAPKTPAHGTGSPARPSTAAHPATHAASPHGKAAPTGKASKHPTRKADPEAANHSKGPPPTWSIRPSTGTRAHASDEEYTDADPPPWNARWGCAFASGSASSLLGSIGVNDDGLRAVLVGDGVENDPGTGCVPYALLTSEESGLLAIALVARDAQSTAPRLHVYTRERHRDALTGRIDVWPPAARYQYVSLDPDDAMWNTGDAEKYVPADLTYSVVSLTRALVQPLEAAVAAAAEVRVITETDSVDPEPHLVSVELVDRSSGRPLGQALWVDRSDLPGGYYAANGESYEPLFWVSPVNFTYVSRGIHATGAAAARAASVPSSSKKSKSKKRQLAQHLRHNALHIGIDYVAPVGTPVVAVADGTVLFAGPFSGYGNLIIIQHSGGYTTHYGHLSAYAPNLTVGGRVQRGQVLGKVGSTGLSSGPHLHFEIRHEGSYIDPLDLAQPYSLWSLRPADYGALARRILENTLARESRADRAPQIYATPTP